MELVSIRTGKEGTTTPSKTAPKGRKKVFVQAELKHEGETFVLSGMAWSRTPIEK